MPGKDDFISDGYAFEHRVVGYLESEGYFAIKSHMSKGIVDVIGIKPGGDIRFVQCKLSNYDGPEFDALVELNERFEDASVEYVNLRPNNTLEFKEIEELIDDNTGDFSVESINKQDENLEEKDMIHDFIDGDEFIEDEKVKISEVVNYATEMLEIEEQIAYDLIEDLKRSGKLFEPEQGYLRSI